MLYLENIIYLSKIQGMRRIQRIHRLHVTEVN